MSGTGSRLLPLLGFVPVGLSSFALYYAEDLFPFAAGPAFVASVLWISVVALWPVAAIEVVLRRPRRWRRVVPAALGLAIFAAGLVLLIHAAATNR